MAHVAVAQGQGITPHSFKRSGGPARFYMRLGADKVSADCTWQIECKVGSGYSGLLLTHSGEKLWLVCTWVYCGPAHQSVSQRGQWADCDMCAWGLLQRPVITDSLKVNCHLKLGTGVDNSHRPHRSLCYKNISFGIATPTLSPDRSLKVMVEILNPLWMTPCWQVSP